MRLVLHDSRFQSFGACLSKHNLLFPILRYDKCPVTFPKTNIRTAVQVILLNSHTKGFFDLYCMLGVFYQMFQ